MKEGDFFKQVDKMGASTNASTGFAETNYYISSNLLNDSDLETKIKLHASMLETPIFATEKLEKEKYEKMIKEKLQEMGYLVEVNGKDSYYPVEKIPSVCDSFYAIIGIRSGILDLATFSNTNVIALYPYESRQYTDYYDIKKTNERKENSWQIILSDNTQEDIQKIVRIIERNVS